MSPALLIAVGLVALLAGGELLVRGAVATARAFGVSPFLIGLTMVGFGTSLPELVTSVEAALLGSPGIAVGNIVGSNIANILLILGCAALIHPLATARQVLRRDGAVVLLASLVCAAVVLVGQIGRAAGGVLVALLLGYIIYSYVRDRAAHDAEAAMHAAEAASVGRTPARPWLALLFAAAGLLLTILGARVLVDGAIALAAAAGVSETLIGLTIVAVGTSLPELVVSLVAAARRQSDVALGNIMGSNIFNCLGILGVTAVVRPVAVPADLAVLHIWVMLAATALLLVFAATGRRLSRLEGAVFAAGYVAYMGYLGWTA